MLKQELAKGSSFRLLVEALIFTLSDFGPPGLCNCDNRGVTLDSGVLSSMTQLPVMELRFGDSASQHSWLEYKLGPLNCSGKKGFYPTEIEVSEMIFKSAFKETDTKL